MPNDSKPPHRRIEAEIHIGADSWHNLHDCLHAIIRELFDAAPNDENLHWVSTNENSGIDLSVTVDHSMTREQYLSDMRNWRAGLKEGLQS